MMPPADGDAAGWSRLLRQSLTPAGKSMGGGAAVAEPPPVSMSMSMPASRRAAVLVPVILGERPEILLTRRADHLRHHAGQVSFPGGRIEPEDSGPEAAALREASEEIGLDAGAVDLIGRLPRHETGTGFLVTPVVGLLPPGLPLRADASEVAAMLTLPLSTLLDLRQPARQRVRMQSGEAREYWVWPHQEHHIWGATAAILLSLAERLRAGGG